MIKGRYVATIEVDIHIPDSAVKKPLTKMKDDFNSEALEYIQKEMEDMFSADMGWADVRVIQQYSDLYRAEEGEPNETD